MAKRHLSSTIYGEGAGLENAVKAASTPPDKVNFVRYADDFIVTASSKNHLENVIVPLSERFSRKEVLKFLTRKQ